MTDFPAYFRSRLAIHGSSRLTFLPEPGDPVVLTFTELDRRARATAVLLAAAGLTDQAVLLLFPAGTDFLAAFLGCLYARVVAVPAPMPDTGPQQVARLGSLIDDASARLVLTDAAHRDQLAALLPNVMVRAIDGDVDGSVDASGWTPPPLTGDTIAYLQYTSGSSSEPRGVRVPHRALSHNLGMIHAMTEGRPRVLASWVPHYHDLGLVGLQLHALYAGADLVFTAPAAFVARPVRWFEMISRYRAEMTGSPDFGYSWCNRRITDVQLAGLDLSSLSIAVNGGEPIRASTLDTFTGRFAAAGFRPDAWGPCYGMAEATLMITGTGWGHGATVRRFDTTALEHHQATPAVAGTDLVASGRSFGLDVRIVNPDTGQVYPDGKVGEIWIAGDSVAAGYHAQPDATRETFPAGPRSHLRTGDLGFIHEGDLYVTGRLKDVIIINGRNLYPQDLEETARLAHPAAGPGAAFAVATPAGPDNVILVQELRRDHTGADHVADAITTALGREYGISVTLILVAPGQVPRTTSGKVRRRHIRGLYLAGQLSADHPVPSDRQPA